MINSKNIDKVVEILQRKLKQKPYVGRLEDPFKILIATILSARTKDEVTAQASKRLFSKVKSPRDLVKLKTKEIEKLIYPVGFYRQKAKRLKELAKILIEKYDAKVPDSLEELVKLPGVGRKTANLVLSNGFGKDAICVDTHVHKITNRWGFVKTKTAYETEMELRKKLPKKYWRIINQLLVEFGKKICKPVKPSCSVCPIRNHCPKIGVKKHR